jgi:hypothetical protein
MIIEVLLRFEKELKQLSKKYKKIKDDLRLFKKEILILGIGVEYLLLVYGEAKASLPRVSSVKIK